jgi:hypothetical protein
MKDENPIAEVWRIRDELSAEYGHDVHRLFAALREEEKKYGDRLVRRVSRPAPEKPAAVLREEPPPYRDNPDGKA